MHLNTRVAKIEKKVRGPVHLISRLLPCYFPQEKSKIDSRFPKFVWSTVAYVYLSMGK